MKDLISERNYAENEFLELLKEEHKINGGPLRIKDVKSKYHLKVLKKQSHLFGKIFGSSSTIVTVVMIVVLIFFIRKCIIKKRERSAMPSCAEWHSNITQSSQTQDAAGRVNLIITPKQESTPSDNEENTAFQFKALTSRAKF